MLVKVPDYLYRASVKLADGSAVSVVCEKYDAALDLLKEQTRGKLLSGPIRMHLYALSEEGPKR